MKEMKESPVFVKMFDFVTWVIPLTVKFPREQRFVVATAIQRATLAAHESLVRAGMSETPTATLTHLSEAGVQLALVRFYIRLSHALDLITTKQYEYAAERLGEIGRLAQAWRRTCQVKAASGAGETKGVRGIAIEQAVAGAPSH